MQRRLILFLSLIVLMIFIAIPVVRATTYTEMPVTKDATCWSCHRHSNYAPVLADQWNSTPVVRGYHPIQNPCFSCHNINIQQNAKYRYCTVCHFPGGSLGITNYFSHRHTSDGRQGFLNLPNVRHPITSTHLVTIAGCEGCHTGSLTKEHNRVGRTDRYGNQITCDTCHAGLGLGDRLNTGGVLRLVKVQDYQIQWSNPYYAPDGNTISRVRITHAMDSGNGFEVHALIQGKWGIVYYRTSGVKDIWFDLPYPATAVKTKMHAPYKAGAGMWGGDVPEVELKADLGAIKQAIVNKDKTCGACHNVAAAAGHPEHLSADMEPFCADCHGFTLTMEQKRHKDDCASCHASQDPQVILAIAQGKTACRDCHSGELAGHPAHEVSFDQSCAGCHGGSLIAEQQRHKDDCGSCHFSSSPLVRETIRLKKSDCFACHDEAHNVLMIPGTPPDIPLITVFRWSLPERYSVWQYESWIPSGIVGEAARVVYSDRKNLPLATVRDALLIQFANQDWLLVEDGYLDQAGKFAARFTKSGRWCLIWCYDGYVPSGSAGPGGIRVFMLYE